MPTPKGGQWTNVKREISDCLAGGNTTSQQIISAVLSAAGGLSISSGGGATRGSGGGGGGRTRTRLTGSESSSLSRIASGLAGFGATIAAEGLDRALAVLGIEDLRGRPAGEVISRIADHLSHESHGLEQSSLREAIQQAILNASELAGDSTYEDLEASLQSFLSLNGIEGLVELFLTQYVFDRVWVLIEDYVNKRTDNRRDVANMEAAIEQACLSQVRNQIGRHKESGSFDNKDWFGRDGIRTAEGILADLEASLRAEGAVQ